MTRFFLFLSLLFVAGAPLSAQFDFEKLYGGALLGYADPVGDFEQFADGGFTYTVVAGYKLTDRLSVGIEYASVAAGGISDDDNSGILGGLEAYGLNNYFVRGSYKLLTGGFAPFVSAGLGLASITEPDVTTSAGTVEGGSATGFGADLELGLSIKGFQLSYSYVIGGNTPEETAFTDRDQVSIGYNRFQLGYVYNF